MSLFIDVVVTGNTEPIGGNEAWERLYSEYTEISANSSASQGLNIAIDVQYYTNRIKNVYFIVNWLRTRRVEGLIDELREMGFNFKFNDFSVDLNRVLTRVKADEMKLSVAIEKYNLLATTKQDTKLEWYRRLGQLAKYQGVANINPALITVLDFVALEKEFMEYVKAQK